MEIYKEFETFVKSHGKKIGEQTTYGGFKTVWEIGDRIVVIDEEPDTENQRIVMVFLPEEDLIEYLSPAAVLGGVLEQISISISPQRISSPSQLKLILEELKRKV